MEKIENKFIKAREAQLYFYKAVSIYSKTDDGRFVLYKHPVMTLDEMLVGDEKPPKELYIKRSDKLKGVQEVQKGLNRQLEIDVKSENLDEVKKTLVAVVEETFTEPSSGSLEGLSETVDILTSDYVKESDTIKKLIDTSFRNYSTVLHSINTMALAITYAFHLNYPRAETKKMALCGLLHDIGKTRINQEIVTAPRKLTDEEFLEMKSHSRIGYNILKKCEFRDKEISLCALEHHEKLNGSGYPDNKRNFSPIAQIIGIIDSFEALTTDDRPYRKSMRPFDVFSQIIHDDVKKGKFSKEIYFQFIKSIGL